MTGALQHPVVLEAARRWRAADTKARSVAVSRDDYRALEEWNRACREADFQAVNASRVLLSALRAALDAELGSAS